MSVSAPSSEEMETRVWAVSQKRSSSSAYATVAMVSAGQHAYTVGRVKTCNLELAKLCCLTSYDTGLEFKDIPHRFSMKVQRTVRGTDS